MTKNRTETPQQSIDVGAVLAKLDAAQLEAQIDQARAGVLKAQGNLRALMSLKRVVDYRDGKRTFARKPLGDRIEKWLGEHQPATALRISQATKAKIPEVKQLLETDARFSRDPGSGEYSLT